MAELPTIRPSVENLLNEKTKRINYLEGHMKDQAAQIAFLREELAKADHARLNEVQKWRKREQDLLTEISLLRTGVSGACSCPAGKCMKTALPGQLCWAQWAGLVAVRDVAQRAIDQALRDAVHPRRTHDTHRDGQMGVVKLPHICSFEGGICACGRSLP